MQATVPGDDCAASRLCSGEAADRRAIQQQAACGLLEGRCDAAADGEAAAAGERPKLQLTWPLATDLHKRRKCASCGCRQFLMCRLAAAAGKHIMISSSKAHNAWDMPLTGYERLKSLMATSAGGSSAAARRAMSPAMPPRKLADCRSTPTPGMLRNPSKLLNFSTRHTGAHNLSGV